VRPWLERLRERSLDALNALAEQAGIRTASGKPVRFVAPSPADPYYEVHVNETGCVSTRPHNWHDFFNALAWLAFPRTKALINVLHAAEIPREGGRRGRLRDLLTIFDEGGAIVACADPELEAMIRGFRWRELFWDNRERVRTSLRFIVLGHAVMDMAREPWPGITCKTIFIPAAANPDASAAQWLEAHAAGGTPKLLAPLPIFGYPGWLPENDRAGFYADERYFRPFRRDPAVLSRGRCEATKGAAGLEV
jgi:hypothetical protein